MRSTASLTKTHSHSKLCDNWFDIRYAKRYIWHRVAGCCARVGLGTCELSTFLICDDWMSLIEFLIEPSQLTQSIISSSRKQPCAEFVFACVRSFPSVDWPDKVKKNKCWCRESYRRIGFRTAEKRKKMMELAWIQRSRELISNPRWWTAANAHAIATDK